MIKILKIEILINLSGPDKIFFHTDLPTPYPEVEYPANLQMDARAGYAEQYVQKNFPGVPVEILNAKRI